MSSSQVHTRRFMIRSTLLGSLVVSLPNLLFAKDISKPVASSSENTSPLHDRYPAIPLSVAEEVVGVSHFNLERLKQLVDPRPELAKATWDWAYGDWESAIAAATHVGRKDIVDYLQTKGAAPTIFTYAMTGQYELVRSMIESTPGVQRADGPHGISLLQHARTGLQADGVNKLKAQKLVDYLQALGDADGRTFLTLDENEKSKFLGDYKYGEGTDDGFTIKLNMRKMISLGKLGKSGGALWRIGENTFNYQGAPSVVVSFDIKEGLVQSLTITEPGLVLKAVKV